MVARAERSTALRGDGAVAVLIQRVVLDPVWPSFRFNGGPGRAVDVRIVGDRIAEIQPHLAARAGDQVLDGGGGTLIPGLHDHHVHLRAWAAAASSVAVGPPEVRSVADLERRLRTAPGAPGTWIRAVGYHESVAGHLDRAFLDRLVPDRPLRVQHRSGVLWVLNSQALGAVGLGGVAVSPTAAVLGGRQRSRVDTTALRLDATDAPSPPSGVELDLAGKPTGRVWRSDRWLHAQLAAAGASQPLDLATISRRGAAAGITGFTDATPDQDEDGLDALARAQQEGSILQRLHLMVSPRASFGPSPNGASVHDPATGEWQGSLGRRSLVSWGPVKLLLDDDRLPPFDALATLVRDAHERGQPVAVHCVTRTQAALTVAVFGAAGVRPGDRMEHGAVLGLDLLPTVRALGLTVVTQPGFVLERGDRYLADIEPVDLADLWRLGSLLDAGVPLAASTDAPFGPDDPWAIIAAAAARRTPEGHLLGPSERVSPRRALALFGGEPARPAIGRVVTPGAVADLVVLAGSLDDALAVGAPSVLATVVAGAVVHRADA